MTDGSGALRPGCARSCPGLRHRPGHAAALNGSAPQQADNRVMTEGMRTATKRYSAKYGRFLDELQTDVAEFLRARVVSRARDLTVHTGQHFNHNEPPQFFTGDLDAPLVLVHLNPKAASNNFAPRFEGTLPFRTFEEYFDLYRHFGARKYGPGSPRTHRSPFDYKQIRFLRPFGVIDFVDERSRDDRFTNLELAIDRKLQLELIPYASAAFSTRGFTKQILEPHYERIVRVITARPRRYVIFCGAVFATLLSDYVTREHGFRLKKRDGSLERQTSRFANLRLPYGDETISAGLAHSWARQGIPMPSYAEEVRRRYGG
jgi:hypothetical protein